MGLEIKQRDQKERKTDLEVKETETLSLNEFKEMGQMIKTI